ncbi:MAG: xanthine dehydrogenase family protein subunit M [Actinomycetia bacterium]|nr:xanthine dehydrogenase family protein subunit M [Actinomycetes bacterium]MCP4226985.1 xanthine dehydrogenase family protein subunit M [Actinomycetes bacterium]MCP5035354.1 xanthine dehydrogenase family protein subunit M [Actinomycetes bacterium]
MIPVAFDYVRASSADEALAALAEHGDDAKLMAGGHSLLPMMKLRLAYPAVIVDIGRLSDLSYINDGGDHLAIGALTRHRDVEMSPVVQEHAPLLAHATSHVGDPQVRHRGTLGGSLAHADAAADHPSVFLAMGASAVVRGPDGEREIDGADFFTGFLESSLEPTEMITEIRVPKATGKGWSFQKFNRRAQDWAIVGASVQQTDAGANVALVNMHSTPIRSAAVEAALGGGANAADAAEQAAEGMDPSGDLNASVEYRQHLARVLTRRGLNEAGIS